MLCDQTLATTEVQAVPETSDELSKAKYLY